MAKKTKEMKGSEIEKLISKEKLVKKHFLGVFSRDNFSSRSLPVTKCVIVNTDHSSRKGRHWFAVGMLIYAMHFFCSSKARCEVALN